MVSINDPLLSTATITADLNVTDRCLRKRVASGRFPAPDANIEGRNYWLTSTYRKWKESAISGAFARREFFNRVNP